MKPISKTTKTVIGLSALGALTYYLYESGALGVESSSGSFGSSGGGGVSLGEEGLGVSGESDSGTPYNINFPSPDTSEIIKFITGGDTAGDTKKDIVTTSEPVTTSSAGGETSGGGLVSSLLSVLGIGDTDKTKKATTISGMISEGISNDNVTQEDLNNMSSLGVITNIITHPLDAFDRVTSSESKGLASIDVAAVEGKSDGSLLGNIKEYGIIDVALGKVGSSAGSNASGGGGGGASTKKAELTTPEQLAPTSVKAPTNTGSSDLMSYLNSGGVLTNTSTGATISKKAATTLEQAKTNNIIDTAGQSTKKSSSSSSGGSSISNRITSKGGSGTGEKNVRIKKKTV